MPDLLTCPAETSSIRRARQFVVDKLQEWHCDGLVDSAALMTSELATNAVVHTGMPYTVCIERQSRGIRVEVTDLVHELPPRPEEVPPLGDDPLPFLDESGRLSPVDINHLFSGLRVVDAVATRWGSDLIPGDGKVVWFELVADQREDRDHRLSDLRDRRSPLRTPDGPDPWDSFPAHAERDGRAFLGDPRHRHPLRWILVVLAAVGVVMVAVLLAGRDGSAMGVVWYGH